MTFDEVVEQVRALLQSKGRVAYRTLKRRFDLNDEDIEDVKAELIKADRVAKDEDGEVLVWVGENSPESSVQSLESEKPRPILTGQTLDPRLTDPRHRPPIAYTPAHLADRIRAVAVTAYSYRNCKFHLLPVK